MAGDDEERLGDQDEKTKINVFVETQGKSVRKRGDESRRVKTVTSSAVPARAQRERTNKQMAKLNVSRTDPLQQRSASESREVTDVCRERLSE